MRREKFFSQKKIKNVKHREITLNSQLLTLNWTDLPPSWYIKYNTDADRQKEIELSSLPAVFSIYEDD